jgi:hypothetical protein
LQVTNNKIVVNGTIFATLYFLINLQMGQIS